MLRKKNLLFVMQTSFQKNVLDSLTPFPTSLTHLRSYLYRNSRNDSAFFALCHIACKQNKVPWKSELEPLDSKTSILHIASQPAN